MRIDGKTLEVNGKQIEIIKMYALDGSRALVDFGSFGISIPHISSYKLERVEKRPDPKIDYSITNEQRQKNLEWYREAREKMFGRK